jgi:hypothetical protein
MNAGRGMNFIREIAIFGCGSNIYRGTRICKGYRKQGGGPPAFLNDTKM